MADSYANEANWAQEDCPCDDSSAQPKPLCPNCLQPVNPFEYFCPHCGSNDAVNPMATYLPILDIRFMYGGIGKLWRRILYGRMHLAKRIALALLMVTIAPVTVPFLLVPTLYYGGVAGRPVRWRIIWIAFAAALLLGLAYLAFLVSMGR